MRFHGLQASNQGPDECPSALHNTTLLNETNPLTCCIAGHQARRHPSLVLRVPHALYQSDNIPKSGSKYLPLSPSRKAGSGMSKLLMAVLSGYA